ncbi:MAG: ABC transporter permease subunit, partial [Enterococcaceae bacterium]|nr:ABC transporter permease subunit [Enterococcaceae bacterium]
FKDFNMIWIAIFALSILSIINSSEIFRGAFSSIKKGQFDAAKSLGMTNFQTIRRVLLPQAFPVSVPMFSNLLITLVKASALASMVSVVDVFAAAKISAQQNYRFLEAYIAVAIIYWIISLIIEKGAQLFEQRMNRKLRRASL